MTLNEWLSIGASVIAVLAAGGTILKILSDRRAGVTSNEHAGRRDTVADRDALINQHQEDLQAARDELRGAVADLRAERLAGDEARRAYQLELEYTQILRDHIYRQKPPPPPDRPKGST